MPKRGSFVRHRKLAAGAMRALAELSPGRHGVVAAFAIQSSDIFPLWARHVVPQETVARFELLLDTADAAAALPRPEDEFTIQLGDARERAKIYRLVLDSRAKKFRAYCGAKDGAALALTKAVAEGAREFSVVQPGSP